MTDTPTFPVVIAEWPRNSREVLRVELDEYRGSKIISIRSWYRDGDQLRPTKSGISVAVRHLPKIATAFANAYTHAAAAGWLDDADHNTTGKA